MDKWNMHTFTGHGVSYQKLSLCCLENGKYKLRDIFNYCIENTQLNLKNICPVIYGYLSYLDNKKEN